MKLNISESQNIEFKQSWRDEYIKWLSAFGNTDGGKLYIGVDDNGEIKGIDNAKKLLEDIPNKVRDILGIMVESILSKKLYLVVANTTTSTLFNNHENIRGSDYYK